MTLEQMIKRALEFDEAFDDKYDLYDDCRAILEIANPTNIHTFHEKLFEAFTIIYNIASALNYREHNIDPNLELMMIDIKTGIPYGVSKIH